MLDDLGAQIVSYSLHVPHCSRKESLHSLGAGLANRLGQLPAILALHPAEQASQHAPYACSYLRPPKAMGNPLV
jgi:hypothetical protein